MDAGDPERHRRAERLEGLRDHVSPDSRRRCRFATRRLSRAVGRGRRCHGCAGARDPRFGATAPTLAHVSVPVNGGAVPRCWRAPPPAPYADSRPARRAGCRGGPAAALRTAPADRRHGRLLRRSGRRKPPGVRLPAMAADRAAGRRRSRVLHIGGGACALARALAAEDPGGRQEVCEVEATFCLSRASTSGCAVHPDCVSGTRRVAPTFRCAARRELGCDRDRRVHRCARAATLITAEALADAARVAPITLINVIDTRSARDVRSGPRSRPPIRGCGHSGDARGTRSSPAALPRICPISAASPRAPRPTPHQHASALQSSSPGFSRPRHRFGTAI